MTWKSFHPRGEVLRTVIAEADARRDGHLPMHVEGVAETFRDELTLLGALTLRWHTRLAGRIERELADPADGPRGAVIDAWHATADELPGVLAILDHHRAEPVDDAMATAMATSTAKEHVLLAVMAGPAPARDVHDRPRRREDRRARPRDSHVTAPRRRGADLPGRSPPGGAPRGLTAALDVTALVRRQRFLPTATLPPRASAGVVLRPARAAPY